MRYPTHISRERAREIIAQGDPDTPPHCNPDVVHAPGDCVFCDETPGWQDGVTEFTPAEANGWGGNVAVMTDVGQVLLWET